MMEKEPDWYVAEIELSDGQVFHIVHNMPDMGNINTIGAAFDNWLARTKVYTERSLIDYINSKGIHTAMTVKSYEKLKQKIE